MTELDTLQHQLMADVAAAADEQAIEALRVAALGKKGSVSELLKTLGTMSPEDPRRRDQCVENGGDRRDQQPQIGAERCRDHRQA
jgi:phenylalanyl-tRNA synthetase alpha chain